MPPEEPDVALATLSMDVWLSIFLRLPFQERLRTIPLVCKAWARLARDAPSPLWRDCELSCLAGKKKGPHQPSDYPDHFHVMRLLPKHGATVREVQVNLWEDNKTVHDFSNSFKAIIGQLPSLEDLHFCGPSAVLRSASDLSYLQHLTLLTRVSLGLTDLTTEDWWHSDSLRPLHTLTALEELQVHVCYKNTRFDNPMDPPVLLDPALSSLSRLTRLDLRSSSPSEDVHANAMNVISCLGALKVLVTQQALVSIPAEIKHCQHLQFFSLEAWWNQIPLEEDCYLPGPQSLESIELSWLCMPCAGWKRFIRSVAAITSLRDLDLWEADGIHELVDEDWVFPQSLTRLRIARSGLGFIPQALIKLTNLSELSLQEDFQRLVDGPYLKQLTWLDLDIIGKDDRPILRSASCLERLLISKPGPRWNRKEGEALDLSDFLPPGCKIIYH